MLNIIKSTLKGIFRDRVFHGILTIGIFLLFIPSAASLSMRQVTELSITLSLSLISFILLLLSVFLGATSLWKDMERRYTFSILSLPISRTKYVIGKFLGLSLFLILTSAVLGSIACAVIKISSTFYPSERSVVWSYIAIAILFTTLKYIVLVAVAILLSTVSTSFFLPVFGTICVFWASSITQQVFEFVRSPGSAQAVSPLLRSLASAAYYVLPNLAGFDLKINAIYSIPLSRSGLGLSVIYFVVYNAILLGGAAILFERREMK